MQTQEGFHLALDGPENVLNDVGVSHDVWGHGQLVLVDLEFVTQPHAELVGEELEGATGLGEGSTRSGLGVKLRS